MYQFHISSRVRTISARTILFLLLIFITPVISFSELVDRVVAVVNDDIITLSEVEQEAEGLYRAIAQKGSGEPLLQALAQARETTIDALINRKIIAQRAEQFNVSVSEEEINNGYEQVRSRSGFSETAFREELAKSGMTQKAYKASLATQILQKKLLSYDVHSKIIITDAMILDYFDENYTFRVEAGSYYLLQIGFSWSKDTGPGELADKKTRTRKRAERVYNLAIKGQNFKMLATKFSDLPSAVDGGDIGIFTLDEMAAPMRSAVASLKPGSISKIVKTDAGYQFFKLLSGEKNAIVVSDPYETVKLEIKKKLFEQKLKEAYSSWVKELKEKAYIQKL